MRICTLVLRRTQKKLTAFDRNYKKGDEVLHHTTKMHSARRCGESRRWPIGAANVAHWDTTVFDNTTTWRALKTTASRATALQAESALASSTWSRLHHCSFSSLPSGWSTGSSTTSFPNGAARYEKLNLYCVLSHCGWNRARWLNISCTQRFVDWPRFIVDLVDWLHMYWYFFLLCHEADTYKTCAPIFRWIWQYHGALSSATAAGVRMLPTFFERRILRTPFTCAPAPMKAARVGASLSAAALHRNIETQIDGICGQCLAAKKRYAVHSEWEWCHLRAANDGIERRTSHSYALLPRQDIVHLSNVCPTCDTTGV